MMFHSRINHPQPSARESALRKRLPSLAPLLTLFSLVGLCLAPASAFAIESPYAATDAAEAERATAEEFASFPAPARRSALVVAGYPESLLEVQRLQQDSADRFVALVESYPRETQAQIWDLVRYPGLAADLARGGKKSSNELDDLADRYPDADHFAIIEEGKKRHDLWVQIYALDLESQQSLSTILDAESVAVQAAFEDVTARPDLMTLLADNIQWTTLQGAAYRENPAKVDARFQSLAEQVAARQRLAESEWSDEVTDPEAAEELEVAAREFADTYGYDYDEELAASASRPATSNTTIIIQQRPNPYPYWFGYPTWYDSAFWYPISFSSHIGFGYGSGYGSRFGGGFGYRYASFGLPSPFFLGWYHDIYRPRYATRNHRRSIRYYDNHRPHRSAKFRRHNRGRDHVNASRADRRDRRDRRGNRDLRRADRRENRRDHPFRVNRDRRGHADALADRALRERRRDGRTDRNRDSRVDRRERRGDRNIRSQARDQARFTRDDRGRTDRRDRRANSANARENRGKRGKRDIRADKRLRNPEIRPGGRPAQRVAERKNDGLRRGSPNLRQARADVPRVSKRERKADRRVDRTARKANRRVDRTTRKAERRTVRSQKKADRRVARVERKSSKRIARADRKASRKQARASSGGGKRRMKAAKQSSRPQRASKSNRGGGGSRKSNRQGGGKTRQSAKLIE